MEVIRKVFSQAKEALSGIRAEMDAVLPKARTSLSPFAPSILSIKIPVDRIREVIGKGGETVQKICKDYSVEVDITDDGLVSVTAKNQQNGQDAVNFIKNMMKEVEVGEIFTGTVVKIIDGTGAIVDLGSGKSGMIHISKIANVRVNVITDYLNQGDSVKVLVLTVDKEKGRVGLQRIVEE